MTYLLTAKGILQQLGTLLVLADSSEPVIGVVLLDAIVASYPVARVVDILGVGAKLRELLVLSTGHAFGFFCDISEDF